MVSAPPVMVRVEVGREPANDPRFWLGAKPRILWSQEDIDAGSR